MNNMTLILDIINLTHGIPSQALLLLIALRPKHGGILTSIKNEFEKQINEYMDKITGIKYPQEAREMVHFILDDNFSEVTKSVSRNQIYINKLKLLKTDTINFYLESISNSSKYLLQYNCDVHSTIAAMVFQIMRLRMVIEPEIQITVNVHKQSKIVYLTVKSFWLNDEGVKERKFSKSIGRADEYPLGKDDPKAIEDGTTKMQEILYDEYLTIYPST